VRAEEFFGWLFLRARAPADLADALELLCRQVGLVASRGGVNRAKMHHLRAHLDVIDHYGAEGLFALAASDVRLLLFVVEALIVQSHLSGFAIDIDPPDLLKRDLFVVIVARSVFAHDEREILNLVMTPLLRFFAVVVFRLLPGVSPHHRAGM